MFVLHMIALVRAATPLPMRLCCSPQLPLIVGFFTNHSSIKATAQHLAGLSVYPKTIYHLKLFQHWASILGMGERCLPIPNNTPLRDFSPLVEPQSQETLLSAITSILCPIWNEEIILVYFI